MKSIGELIPWRLPLLAATSLLTACAGTTTYCEPPTIPSSLTEPCKSPVLASQYGWARAHQINAAAWAECRIQLEALVNAVNQ